MKNFDPKTKKAARSEQRKAAEQKKKIVKISIISVVAVILCAAIVFGAVWGVKYWQDSGNFLRTKVAVKSDNYKVDDAMLSYQFYTFYDEIYSSLGTYGISNNSSLKSQTFYSNYTWFDYLMNSVVNQVAEYVYYCEWGKANSVPFTDETKADIDSDIELMKENAEEDGISFDEYLVSNYGRGVKEKDVRNMLEIQYYGQICHDAFAEAHEATDEQITAYYNAHKDDFTYASVISYSLENVNYDAVKASLAKVDSYDAYKAYITTYLLGKGKSEDEAKETVDALVPTDICAANEGEIVDFAFADDAKVGNTIAISESDNSVSIYYLSELAHRYDYKLKNVRHILLKTDEDADKEVTLKKAQSLLDEYLEDPTEDNFIAICKDNSEDTTASNGGLIADITKGNYVKPFEDWCFDEERKPGDTGIVESTYGYHIMYFVNEGEEKWSLDVADAILAEAESELANSFTVKFDEEKLASVPGDVRVKK